MSSKATAWQRIFPTRLSRVDICLPQIDALGHMPPRGACSMR
jgi:hypothetical protein